MIQVAQPSLRTAERLEALSEVPIQSAEEAIELVEDAIALEQLMLKGAWGAVDHLVDEMMQKRGLGE